MTLRRVAEEVDAAAGRRQGRVAGLCRGRAAAGGAGADGPGPDGGVSRLARWNCSGPSRRPTSGRRPAISADKDQLIRVEAGEPFNNARQLRDLVVGVFDGRPVFLKDVARVEDGPEEVDNYVRHGWGPARGFTKHEFFPGTVLGEARGRRTEAIRQPVVRNRP